MTMTNQTFNPVSQEELVDFVRQHSESQESRINTVGGNTASHCGMSESNPARQLSTLELNRIVDYATNDMTITVQAGNRIGDLEGLLNQEGQTLPIVVPYADSATVGGAIAANAVGSLSFSCGSWRDYLLGMTAVNGRGELIHAGGRVVKNVAGYDLNKLMVGSLGMFGVLTEVTLQVKPLPERSAALCFGLGDAHRLVEILKVLNTTESRPSSIDLLNRSALRVAGATFLNEMEEQLLFCVGFQGFSADVDWQLAKLESVLKSASLNAIRIEDGGHRVDLWQSMTDLAASGHQQNSVRIDLPTSRIQMLFEAFERKGLIENVDIIGQAGNGVMFIHFDDEHAEDLKKVQTEMATKSIWDQDIAFTLQHASTTVIEQALWPFFRLSETNHALVDGLLNAFDPHQLFWRERYGLNGLSGVAT